MSPPPHSQRRGADNPKYTINTTSIPSADLRGARYQALVSVDPYGQCHTGAGLPILHPAYPAPPSLSRCLRLTWRCQPTHVWLCLGHLAHAHSSLALTEAPISPSCIRRYPPGGASQIDTPRGYLAYFLAYFLIPRCRMRSQDATVCTRTVS